MKHVVDPVLDSYFAFPEGGKHIRDMNRDELLRVIAWQMRAREQLKETVAEFADLARGGFK